MNPKITLIHFTDIHWEKSCSYRVDNPMEALADKFAQVKAYGNQYKVKAYLCSGDLFNQKRGEKVPYDVAIEATRQIKSLNRPVFAISGNHDAYLGTIEKHPLKLMFESGTLIQANSTPKLIHAEHSDTEHRIPSVGILGFEHKYSKDVAQFNVPPTDDNTPLIALTHLVVGKEPGLFYKEEMYGIEEFRLSPIRVFCNGHIHSPLGPLLNSEKQVFLQPGALRRTNTASEELGRNPQVTLIEIEWTGDPKPKITYKYLPIVAREGIFRDWKKQLHEDKKEETNKFVDTVQAIRTSAEVDIVQKVKDSDAEPDVKNLVLEYLDE